MSNGEKALESAVLKLGTEVFEEIQGKNVSLFNPDYFTGKLINWAMEDEEFRTSLFRFVDVLPFLPDSAAVIRHVKEYFTPVAHRIPGLLKWGLNIEPDSLMAKATAAIVRRNVKSMAERFILGENPEKAMKALKKIRKQGLAFTVDLLGEATVSEKESKRYVSRYCELIRALHGTVPAWPEGKPIIEGHPGEDTPVNISVKLSALYSQTKAVSTRHSVSVLSHRLGEILGQARECGAFVNVDMEDTRYTDITIQTVKRVLESSEFRQYDRIGFVLQAYLRRTEDDLKQILDWNRRRGARLGIRLVKGAYWDTETIQAKLAGWPIPVWQVKETSDFTYERITRKLLDNHDHIYAAFGSHNIRSLCHAICYAEDKGLDHKAYELQSLFGMAEPIKSTFAGRGFLVRDYAPIGELIPGMGYLVRRLLENTSNKGFIRQGFHDNESAESLLTIPVGNEFEQNTAGPVPPEHRTRFTNSPLRDFSLEHLRTDLGDAIEHLRGCFEDAPMNINPILSGEAVSIEEGDILGSVSPEKWSLVLGRVTLASEKTAARAIERLKSYYPEWRDTPVEERAAILHRTAEILERDRTELTALIILECGKPWIEADADVAEAIDFLNYYALQARALFTPRKMLNLAGEEDLLFYDSRGLCAVIAPWNFPLAIPCGMFSAALVTGNCAILKPAEQSPCVAFKVFEAFLEAGLPVDAAAFLPGYGETVGEYLVTSPDIATIVFTGSKAVGLGIVEKAARVLPGQEHIKRVIAEMGGKNAIIVDGDADLDQAIKGVIYSAFGYSGQKCSACSRVYVHEHLYERFTHRLADAVSSLRVGPSSDPATEVGPVIDQEAVDRLNEAIEHAMSSCGVLVAGNLPERTDDGWFVAPHVFCDLPEDHPLLSKELFGPVLAVVKVPDFESGLQQALASEYGLTGGVFSRSPENLKNAVKSFRVGNLYLNRGCTGAQVERHPFGGAKMSGVGSKAGGPDYLMQFVIPRTVCENTLRQGFAPMEENP